MTLEKAIAQLSVLLEGKHNSKQAHQAAAIGLGIKALERIHGLRSSGYYIGMPLLKGETKEEIET